MAVNLINLLQDQFSTETIANVGSFLGESPAKTQTALGYALPAILGAVAQKSQTPEGASDLFGMLQRGGFDGAKLGSLLKGGSGPSEAMKVGAPLVGSLFGARKTGLMDWISSAAGISSQSSASLLGLAMPVVLSLLGREATAAGGFNASSVGKLLGGQAPFLRKVAPAGLASVLGLTGFDEPIRTYKEPARAYAEPVRVAERARVNEQSEGGLGWLKWALPLLLLPLLLWGLNAMRRPEPARNVVGTAGTPALTTRSLSCGQTLDIAQNGVEASLLAYIGDATKAVDKEAWFSFDRLEFETGSAMLRASSQAQLRNIAEILKCYQQVNLKVGGYTDNVGNPASNLNLSQARANNTRQAILANGLDPSRVEAEGYGEQFPVASNDTEQGRQRNRRIDVRVTKK